MEIDEIKQRVLEDVDPTLRKQKKRAMTKAYVVVGLQFILLIVGIFAVFYMMMGISTVDGSSMYPTLHDREVVIYQRRVAEFQVGDVVVVKHSEDHDYVKRVIAIAGDVVMLQDGDVYVNGKEVDIKGPVGRTMPVDESITFPYTVEAHSVFVLGDNRENSEDSRSFGSVDISTIRGKLRFYLGKL